jgi:branched-chain amino acid transport system permease protein
VSNHKDDDKATPRHSISPVFRRGRPPGFLAGALQSWQALTGNVWVKRLVLVAVAVLLVALPRIIVSNYWVRIVDIAGLYVMMALGYNLMFGYTGLFNLGFAAYFAIGAYVYAMLASPLHGLHLPFLLILPVAVGSAGLVSYLLGIPSISLVGDYLGLVTLAFAEILRILGNNLSITNAAYGIVSIDAIRLPLITLKSVRDYYYLILPLCVIVYFIIKRLEQSRIGRAWMAIRNDEEAAKTSGLDTRQLKLLACAIGVAPVGLAGTIFAGMQTFVSPESFTSRETWLIIAMAIVGGLGNADGAVLGAILLTILPEPLRGTPLESARTLIYGLLLIFFSLFRPQGLLPRRHRAEEVEAEQET